MAFTYFRTPPEKRRQARVMLGFCIAALVFGLCALIVWLRIAPVSTAVTGGLAAVRYRADQSVVPFGQVSVYYGKNTAFSKDDVYSRRAALESQLEQNSITAPSERGRVYLDCYSGEESAVVRTERASVSVTLMPVGGEFFYFHPLTLVSGCYLPAEGDLLSNVVLDEYAAWQLFGALDVAGMEVTVGDQVYTICGVVKKPSEPAAAEAYGDTPRVYINEAGYGLYSRVGLSFTSYEVLLPEPIKNFSLSLVKTALGVNETNPDIIVRSETDRFSFRMLLSSVRGFFLRVMRRDAVIFPFWENAALVAESKCILLALVFAIFAVLGVIGGAVAVILWFRIHPITVRGVWNYFDAKIDHRRAVRYRKKHNT